MTEYNEGDLVEAVKGESVARGRIRDAGVGPFIDIPDLWTVALLDEGYTIRTIEKAAPPLPTEPGVYEDKDGDVWKVTPRGDLYLPGFSTTSRKPHTYAPFTRLEPVPVTAEKIAAFLDVEGRFAAAERVRAAFGANS